MLRLIHSQTTAGPLLVNDIDDGLPNKTARRLSAVAHAGYQRDGYANATKQACYVPYTSHIDSTLPGYIDITETDKVLLSQAKGTIAGFVAAGLLTVTSFVAGDIATPVLTTAAISAGDLTLTGTSLTSIAPNITSVFIKEHAYLAFGAGNAGISFTAPAIGTGGNAVTVAFVVAGAGTPLTIGVVGNAITVNVATDGGSAATSTALQVQTALLASAPAQALAVSALLGTGGTVVAAHGVTNLAGGLDLTLTAAAIVAGTGTVAPTSIFIPAALVPGISVVAAGTAQVTADRLTTSAVAFT